MMIFRSGFRCFLCAALLYHLSQRTGRDVEFLNSVTRVDQLKDLAQLLKEESKVLPLIIAVSGTVVSETPIKCERSGILGVILEEAAQHHFLQRNWKFSWVQDCALIRLPMSNKEVPWYLDDGTGRVTVAGAQSAIGFALTVGSEVLEKPETSSLVRGILDYLQGLKMLGVRRIEHVLPIGTWLTVVGEAVKDDTGHVRIQKPEQGPFYVSHRPLDQLIPKLGKWSRRFKCASMGASIGLTARGLIITSKPVIEYILTVIEDILVLIGYVIERRRQGLHTLKRHVALLRRRFKNLSMGFTLLGTILISKPVVKYILMRIGDILERRRLRLLRKRVVNAAAKKTEEDGPDLCVICLERKCNAAFVECGHMCCCITCSSKLQGKTCPLCREQVVAPVLKVYRN